MKTKLLLPALTASILSGCTLGNFNSIHREFDLDEHQSQWVDVKQRAIFVSKDGYNISPSGTIICAEPSPDALAVYGASVAAEGGNPAGVSVNLQGGTQESGAAFGLRTQSIQLLRDNYYRLCEAYMSGAIGPWAYHMMLRRLETNTIAYLAIEQLTDALAKSMPTPASITVNTPKVDLTAPQNNGTSPGNGTAGAPGDSGSTGGTGGTTGDTTGNGGATGGSPSPTSARRRLQAPAMGLIPATFVEVATTTAGNPSQSNKPDATNESRQTSNKDKNGNQDGKSSKKKKKKDDQAVKDQSSNDEASSGQKDSTSYVSHEVKKIVKDIIDGDQSLPLCFSFFADKPYREKLSARSDGSGSTSIEQLPSAYCSQIIQTTMRKNSVEDQIAKFDADKVSAFDKSCLDPDKYKANQPFCDFMISQLPYDDLLPKSKKKSSDGGNNTSSQQPGGKSKSAGKNANNDFSTFVGEEEENSAAEASSKAANPPM